jgi:thiosulfate/3-mercaptopyruvate sulfurtransferase
MLKIPHTIVTPNWLYQNKDAANLVILDGTIPKVTSIVKDESKKEQIKSAIFFDIKKDFSVVNAKFPNTVLSPDKFEENARKIGINKDSCIVVYDDLGIYSSPRVWWLFKLMGFNNIAVLDGGLPAWIQEKYPTEISKVKARNLGNFKAKYQPENICFTADVLEAIAKEDISILDARSSGRFYGTAPEPRKGAQSGKIPNSKSLPYATLLENNIFKSEEVLKTIFSNINTTGNQMIFSCGTGITACILALGAELAGYKNNVVYDGSWTEWGSDTNNPIENKKNE